MKTLKKLLFTCILSILLTGITATLPPELLVSSAVQANAATVSLSKKTTSVSLYGKTTVQLKHTKSKKKVKWSNSNSKITSVKASGSNGYKATITGKKAGKTTITAKYNGKTYTVTVTVKAPAINKKAVNLTAGKKTTLQLNNTISSKKVSWKSSKNNVASIKASGKKVTVTAKKAGTATITASYGGKKYSCKVTVKATPKKIKIAIAKDTTGNTGSIVSMLNRCNNVSCKIVNASCNVSEYDGLILPGGVDINPALYGQKNTASKNINKSLDKLQYTLLNKFVTAGKPVLGICRGMQLINVYFGGTLKQDIKNHRGTTHNTATTTNSWVYNIYKKTSMNVNSWHHQTVQKLGDNLTVTQRSKKDNIIEAFEHKTLPVYGVQYHPETMSNGKSLFQAFIRTCRQYQK